MIAGLSFLSLASPRRIVAVLLGVCSFVFIVQDACASESAVLLAVGVLWVIYWMFSFFLVYLVYYILMVVYVFFCNFQVHIYGETIAVGTTQEASCSLADQTVVVVYWGVSLFSVYYVLMVFMCFICRSVSTAIRSQWAPCRRLGVNPIYIYIHVYLCIYLSIYTARL